MSTQKKIGKKVICNLKKNILKMLIYNKYIIIPSGCQTLL